MQTRKQILDKIIDEGVISIIRATSSDHIQDTARAIADGGVHTIEVTLNTPGAIPAIRDIAMNHPDILIGAGTVLNDQAAKRAIEAGAQFIVSPNTKAAVIETTHHFGKVAIPGAFTPNEIAHAMDLYADIVKIFPANDLGPTYLRNIRGPFDDLQLMPTGGVNRNNIHQYFHAGARVVGIGSQLACFALMSQGRFSEITERAQGIRQAVDKAQLDFL